VKAGYSVSHMQIKKPPSMEAEMERGFVMTSKREWGGFVLYCAVYFT